MDEFNNNGNSNIENDNVEYVDAEQVSTGIPDGNTNDGAKSTSYYVDKPKNGKDRRILSYVLVGVLCATIGGAVGGAGSLYLIKNTNLLGNTSIGKSIIPESQQSSTTTKASQISSVSGGLSIADIAKKVGPAVVGVSTKSIQSSGRSFLNPYGSQQEVEGMGSGIIISDDGYILTNNHVIQGASQVTVILNNGKEVPAKVVNYDAAADVAVVKMTESVKVPAVAEFGDSDKVQVGETVVAIGNPLGKDLLGTVTSGIISATNREIDVENKSMKFLQTDAAINAGNSGGPLVNSQGQVIGINTAKIGTDGVEGLGFSIPINQIKSKIQNLVKPMLKIGIAGRDIDEKTSKEYKIPVGAYVQEVQEFSAAEKAGIKAGDVIVKFDGQKIASVNDINTIKAKHKSGDVVKVEVVRDTQTKTLSLKLSE